MPGHTRLYRRGATYYHRAAIPVDIKGTYPKSEETFSLRTKDYDEALKRVRVAAVEVDRKFDEHRKQEKLKAIAEGLPPRKELSADEIMKVEEAYYAYLLQEDEDTRFSGFYEGDELELPAKTFEEHVADTELLEDVDSYYQARGKVSPFYLDEAEEVLSWSGIRLEKNSPSLKVVARALQAASIKATESIKERNLGKVVTTPTTQAVETTSLSPLLSQVGEEWASEKQRTGEWRDKTGRGNRVAFEQFMGVVGDRPISDYTKADGRKYKSVLLKLPANWVKQKELVGLPIEKAADTAVKLGMKPMSLKNMNKLLGFVSAFWNWTEKNYDDAPANPIKGTQVAVKKTARDERDPFTIEELDTIFKAPVFTGCKTFRLCFSPGDTSLREYGRYWVPLIALFTGMRMSEIVQLYTEDIREEGGVLYFDLNDNGDDKKLKTAHSHRKIPVHQELVALGFMGHVEQRRKGDEQRLFPEMEMGDDGYYSTPYSKHFGRFLKASGVKHSKNGFHSFRHSFEDACRESDISKEIMDALQGHREEGMSARYGSGFSLSKLSEAMKKLSYRDLDLSHLYVDTAKRG